MPLLVGGSGLYVRAVLEEFEFPGTDPALRGAAGGRSWPRPGPAPLHARLRRWTRPPPREILPGNGRRIVRALEVIELTGAPFTAALPEPTPSTRRVQLGVDLDTATLDERIAARVDRMWAAGLVDEVAGAGRGRAARGPHGQPGARLPAGAAACSTGS